MRSLEVDLRSKSRPPAVAWTALMLLVGLACGVWIWVLSLHLEARDLKAQIARASERSASVDRAELPMAPALRESLRQAMLEADPRWPDALRSIETAKVPGVMLVSIDMSVQEQLVRVSVEAGQQDQILGYVAELNIVEAEQPWRLVQMESRGGKTVVSALIERRWR